MKFEEESVRIVVLRAIIHHQWLPVLIPISAGVLVVAARPWLKRLRETAAGAPHAKLKEAIAGLLLVLVFAAAMVPFLGATTLYDRDEGYYAECAREMLESGNLVVPHFAGKPWMEKPPLTFWTMAASMKAFGVSEFAARLPSALAALAAIWLTFKFASRMYSPFVGVLSAGILGTTAMFSVVGRLALLDTTLLCCLLISMYGFWKFLDGRRWAILLFYAGCGLGGLAKGPLGVALPFIAVAGYAAFARDWRVFLRMRLIPAVLIVPAIIAAWAVPANLQTGGEFFHELVWARTLQPIISPLQGHGGSNWWQYVLLVPLYVPVLFFGFLPWSFLLFPAIRNFAGDQWRQDKRMALLAGWAVSQFIIFSLVMTKLPHHILPIFPAVAMIGGVVLDKLIDKREELLRGWTKYLAWSAIVLLLAVAAGIVFLPNIAGFRGDEWMFFAPAGATMLVAGVIAGFLVRWDFLRAFVCLFVGSMLCFALLWRIGLPQVEDGKSAQRVADFLRSQYPTKLNEIRIGRFGYREVSVVFYLQRPVDEIQGESGIKEYIEKPGPAVVIIPDKEFRKASGIGLNVKQTIWQRRVWLPEKNAWLDLDVVTNSSDK